MARLPRAVVPGVPMHVTQRGNNRTTTFRERDDFKRYQDALREASMRYRCAIHAYVLMSNHVHLLVTPDEEDAVSRMMQLIGRCFVRFVNKRYQRTGTLWEGRYRSSLVDSEGYLLACARYVELNPVRAGMVEGPRQYRWSSHPHNAYGDHDLLISPHPVYTALGREAAERQAAYRALFARPMELHTLDAIRRAVSSGNILGGTPFRVGIEAALRR